MEKVFLGKFDTGTILAAYAIIGEDEAERIINEVIDEELTNRGWSLDTEVEREQDDEEHKGEIYVYAYIK